MSYLPGDVLASLSSLSSRLDSLQAPLSSLASLPHDRSPALEAATTELTLAYAQYVLVYLCRKADGEDGVDIKAGVRHVKDCAEAIQEAMNAPRPTHSSPSPQATTTPSTQLTTPS